jgi:hypothetical protein
MYIYIVWNVQEQLLLISSQVKLLGTDVPPAIAGPLREKRRMYICLQLLILVSAAMEVGLSPCPCPAFRFVSCPHPPPPFPSPTGVSTFPEVLDGPCCSGALRL